MTIGEVMMIGVKVGEKYVDEMAEQMVKNLIDARLSVCKRRLHDARYKDSHKKIRDKVSILEKAETMDFYKVLVDKTRNGLIDHFKQTANNVDLDLINAEYFGFTGRLK